MDSSAAERTYDIVLWGATGFTGRLVAEYLLRHEGVGRRLRWAVGGRNQQKLESVREGLAQLDPAARQLPIELADAKDPAALQLLAAKTRVMCSTVGPYARYGSELVAACVARGTHYCDLTGEAPWMAEMIAQHHAAAQASGVRIVHACGFDSLPSDLGSLLAHRQFQAKTGEMPATTTLYVRSSKGGFSGGTVASMLAMMEDQRGNPALRKALWDPYSLLPSDAARGPKDVRDVVKVQFDPQEQSWVGPFVMAPTNAKVVRRTIALLEPTANAQHRYTEVVRCGKGPKGWLAAQGLQAGTAAMVGALMTPVGRAILEPLLPQPGEGPSAEVRNAGRFRCDVVARGGSQSVRVAVRGNLDPGYGATSGMLAEAALCLAQDDLQTPCGVITPAVAMGDALLARLGRAGVTFETIES